MICFRPLQAAHFDLLLNWLQRPHVKEWWDDGDDTLEKVAAHYGADDSTQRFIAERDSVAIGYCQYYPTGKDEIGCDLFLCEPRDLSRGIGTQSLRAFIRLVEASEAPTAILVDPHPANSRAIRCYEKCGFIHHPGRSSASVHVMLLDLQQTANADRSG